MARCSACGAPACRFTLNEDPATRSAARLVGYVLAGATDEQKADIVAGLPAAHLVVDTDDDAQRRRFIESIRDLGRRGDRQEQARAEG